MAAFDKAVRAYIEEIRKQNGGTFFKDDPDARNLCKLVYYGWLKPEKYGPKGFYNLFLKTKHISDPEYRAFVISERVLRPWSIDQFYVLFFSILDKTSNRGGNTNGRSLIDSEIPNLTRELEKCMQDAGLSWYTPYLAKSLLQIKKEGLFFQAECDLVDEAERRIEDMLLTKKVTPTPGFII
jgi:hypothetical protein